MSRGLDFQVIVSLILAVNAVQARGRSGETAVTEVRVRWSPHVKSLNDCLNQCACESMWLVAVSIRSHDAYGAVRVFLREAAR